MRTGKLTIRGVEYPLCFSTRVVCDAQIRFGGLPEMTEAMRSGDLRVKLDAVTWALARMLDAGDRYAKLSGEPHPDRLPPNQEDLLDLYGPDDLLELVTAVYDTINASSSRDVESEAPKNAEAAPEST